jgi:hypothetical protein
MAQKAKEQAIEKIFIDLAFCLKHRSLENEKTTFPTEVYSKSIR